MVTVLGLILGLAIGWFSPFSVPVEYSKYLSVAILAALDSVLGVFVLTRKTILTLSFSFGFLYQHFAGRNPCLCGRPNWGGPISGSCGGVWSPIV